MVQINAKPEITVEVLREELSSVSSFLGFEEKLEGGVVDTTNKWSLAVTGTGALGYINGFVKLSTGTTLNSSVRIRSLRFFQLDPQIIGESKQLKKLRINFTFASNSMTDLDESISMIGMVTAANDDRGDAGHMGIVCDDGVFYFETTFTGTEKTEIPIVVNNYYEIEIIYDGSSYKLYADKVLVATHTEQLPKCKYLCYVWKNSGTVNNQIQLAFIRGWYE